MPSAKQISALAVVGGLGFLAGKIAQNLSNQTDGIGGFVVGTLGGALGSFGGVLLLSGHGLKLA